MAIVKRRLDICGREKTWQYLVEAGGRQYRVTARQVGKGETVFLCSCGICTEGGSPMELFFADGLSHPCNHIAEVQRDLRLARLASEQMIR